MSKRTRAVIRARKQKKAFQRRGSPSHINNLPFEILALIFLTIRDAALSLEWLRVASVCRHWRHVALETGTLWAQLRLLRPLSAPFVSVLLDRSGEADLHLEVNTMGGDINGIVALILQHVHRLCSLSISFHYDQTLAVQRTLDGVKPRLRTLALRADYEDVAGDDMDNDIYVVSSLSLSPPDVPALRHLSIAWVIVETPYPILRDLVSLELDGFNGQRLGLRIDRIEQWIRDVLETASSTLEHLTLKRLDRFDREPETEPMEFLKLRNLNMREDNSGEAIASFLNIIRLPATASLNLHSSSHNRWHVPSMDFADTTNPIPFLPDERGKALPALLRAKVLPGPRAGKDFECTAWADGAESTVCQATAYPEDLPYGEKFEIMSFPMVGALDTLLPREIIEEFECHFPAQLDMFGTWPGHVGGFLKLRRCTFGGTRAIKELLVLLSRCGGIPTLEEITLCVLEVADSILDVFRSIAEWRSCGKGKLVAPPVLRFRLPQRMASCTETRVKIARLNAEMIRTSVEVYFLDCEICHRKPPKGKQPCYDAPGAFFSLTWTGHGPKPRSSQWRSGSGMSPSHHRNGGHDSSV